MITLYKGRDYLIQPITNSDAMVSTPYGLIEGNNERSIHIRIANVNKFEVTIEEGKWIATLDSETWIADVKAGSAFKSKNKKADFDWKGMCCEELDNNKTAQLMDLLRKHKSVFYDGKTLPIVKVVVLHLTTIP